MLTQVRAMGVNQRLVRCWWANQLCLRYLGNLTVLPRTDPILVSPTNVPGHGLPSGVDFTVPATPPRGALILPICFGHSASGRANLRGNMQSRRAFGVGRKGGTAVSHNPLGAAVGE